LSPQWVAYTAIPEVVQLNLGWIEQIHPDDRTAIFTSWSEAVRNGQPFRFEARIRRSDGQYRWFEKRATPLRNVESQIVKWFGVSTDIHEARETRTALELERERLARIVALTPGVFCSFCLRPDGSTFFPYASSGILDMYGFHPDVLKKDASPLFAIVHPADSAGFQTSITSSAKTLSLWSLEFRILHPDKGERWIAGQATPNVQPDGSIVWHGFLADITERKRLEFEQHFLLELGTTLQQAIGPEAIADLATQRVGHCFNASRCSLSAINFPKNEATLLHEYVSQGEAPPPGGTHPLTMWGSPQWLQVLSSGIAVAVGNTASDPITAPFYENAFRLLDIAALVAVPLRRVGEWVAVLTVALAENREWSPREIEFVRAAAERIWLAYESACARAAERALHQTLSASEERLSLALQSAAIGIWEQNPETGEILWDLRCQQIFGFPHSKLDSAAAIACIHPEDRELVLANAKSYIDPAGSGHFDMEFRIHAWDDGTLRYVYDKGQTFFEGEGASGKAIRSIGTLQNVTVLKANERALRLANEDLEEFAYVASHDLKAPLRVIDNAAMWLEEDLAVHLTAETRDHMNLLRGRVKRMDKLLDDLLEYARIGRKTDERYTETLAGDALIDNILALLSPAGFAVVVSPGFAAVQVQRMPLQQILMNLMSNAIKHHDKKTGRIELTVEDCGAHYVFAVKDDGPGIPARFQKQIFEMFQTLRPRDQVEGSGMGLAMVRKNIEVFGGTLDLKSSEGQGSIFRFTWPKRQKMSERRAP
jgi:signal transduction histidine kinase